MNYTTTELVWIIAGMTLSTILTRNTFSLLPKNLTLPKGLQRVLSYTPAAAIAALIATATFASPDQLTWEIALQKREVIGLVVAAGVFLKSKRADATFLCGFLAYWLIPHAPM
jgi:branched-subunit amino acid transport protein